MKLNFHSLKKILRIRNPSPDFSKVTAPCSKKTPTQTALIGRATSSKLFHAPNSLSWQEYALPLLYKTFHPQGWQRTDQKAANNDSSISMIFTAKLNTSFTPEKVNAIRFINKTVGVLCFRRTGVKVGVSFVFAFKLKIPYAHKDVWKHINSK